MGEAVGGGGSMHCKRFATAVSALGALSALAAAGCAELVGADFDRAHARGAESGSGKGSSGATGAGACTTACACADGSKGRSPCGEPKSPCICSDARQPDGGAPRCGNGALDPGEECEPTNLGGATCASATGGSKRSGTLLCTATCTLDTTRCASRAIAAEGGRAGDGSAGTSAIAPDATSGAGGLGLYVILDQSGSMADGTPSKWQQVASALDTFMVDPSSSGLEVAFQVFSRSFLPPSGCGDCTGVDCATPLVPMAPLPGNASAISNALKWTPLGIGTPTEAALRGGTTLCAQVQDADPSKQCVFVLVTDGPPTDCSQDTGALAAIAGDAFTQKGVRTLVIGLPDAADFSLLDEIARQGGTDCTPDEGHACRASSSAEILAALELIR